MLDAIGREYFGLGHSPDRVSAMPSSSRRRRIVVRLAIVVASLLVADVLAGWLVLGDGWLAGRRIAPFDPPLFMPAQFDTLDRLAAEARGERTAEGDVVFDPDLGWTLDTAESQSTRVDSFGGRVGRVPVPRARREGVQRLVTCGCSFTYGSEVEIGDDWPATLDAEREDVEVINLGVPGYGIDQSLLRYRALGPATDADEVWLGVLPATVLRLVSTYRPALRHYTVTVAVKPRFVHEADGIKLIPSPARSLDDLVALLGSQERFAREVVPNDSFMAAWPAAYAPFGSHPSHWSATARMGLTYLERGGRDWARRIADPTDETHTLSLALIAAMRAEVEAEGRRFCVLLLPDRGSLANPADVEAWQGWVRALRAAGVDLHDPTQDLIAAGMHRNADEWAPDGHYSAKGNARIAAWVSGRL